MAEGISLPANEPNLEEERLTSFVYGGVLLRSVLCLAEHRVVMTKALHEIVWR